MATSSTSPKRCGGTTRLGRSTNIVLWTFIPQNYFNIEPLGGPLHEESCAISNGDGSLVLDFLHVDADNQFAAAKVPYDSAQPFTNCVINLGGSFSRCGLLKYQGNWLFGQGWDAPQGSREMYFYRAEACSRSRPRRKPGQQITAAPALSGLVRAAS